MVNKKPDTSEKNDEEINLNLVIVNKERIFTGAVSYKHLGTAHGKIRALPERV